MMVIHRPNRSPLLPFLSIAKHTTQIRGIAGWRPNSARPDNQLSDAGTENEFNGAEIQGNTQEKKDRPPLKLAVHPGWSFTSFLREQSLSERSHERSVKLGETSRSHEGRSITNTRDRQNLRISSEVTSALNKRRPVVALESTIYTHGFPFPDNVSLALDLEQIVRNHGAIPATIGIIDGVACVGLNEREIISLATSAGDPRTMKVSRRDLPFILGMGMAGTKLNGGTTIAATMLLASRAGIAVFGTGGLGGVHRGAESTMDISADLTELGRTPVAVISSGCKSFLDIPRTLEYLETQGVTVCTFADGRTGKIDFPAFFTRESGSLSPLVVQNPREAAAIIRAQELTYHQNARSGLFFANPIPEKHAMPKSEIDKAIEQAVQEATEKGFHGHANTPFILSKIKELTKGNSIPANRALIESNVAMAAQVAVELAELRRSSIAIVKSSPDRVSMSVIDKTNEERSPSDGSKAKPDIIVIGSVAMDLSCDYSPEKDPNNPSPSDHISPKLHTSNIATVSPSIGGVGYNVALAAQFAGKSLSVSLRSFVAQDLAGTSILSTAKANGLDTSNIIQLPATHTGQGVELYNRTAQYVAVNDANKSLVVAMADMSIFNDVYEDPSELCQHLLEQPRSTDTWVVIDANWAPSILKCLLSGRDNHTKIIFEPVSVPKAGRIFDPADTWNRNYKLEAFPKHHIHLSTPNQHELAAMHAAAKKHDHFETERWWQVIDALGIPSSGARDRFISITNRKLTDEGVPLQTIQLLPYIPTILTKLGDKGVLLTELLKPNDPRLTDPEASPFILSRNANGSDEIGGVYMRLFPPTEVVDNVVSVNGVGDTFLGVLVAGLAQGCKLDERLIDLAQKGAVMTLRSKASVCPGVGLLDSDLRALGSRRSAMAD